MFNRSTEAPGDATEGLGIAAEGLTIGDDVLGDGLVGLLDADGSPTGEGGVLQLLKPTIVKLIKHVVR